MPKNVEILNFEQLLKHILRVFPSLGGVNSILWGIPFWYSALHLVPTWVTVVLRIDLTGHADWGVWPPEVAAIIERGGKASA